MRACINLKSDIKTGCIFLFLFFLAGATDVFTQEKEWNGKNSAVCLTYDDGLNVHLDNVIPILDSLGFTATFYVPGNSSSFHNRINEWKAAAKKGNELGNHTLFHPCNGKLPGRDWVNADYDLSNYTVQRMEDEISTVNLLFRLADGKTKRTFAYPCGEMTAGDVSYVDKVKENFVAARGVQAKLEKLTDIDLYNIGCFMINGQNEEYLISLVDDAIKNNSLVVFLFHGVGGEHSINVSIEAHNKLLQYIKQNESNIWVAPLVEIGEYIKENKAKSIQ